VWVSGRDTASEHSSHDEGEELIGASWLEQQISLPRLRGRRGRAYPAPSLFFASRAFCLAEMAEEYLSQADAIDAHRAR
jgi:hypothetical protein